MRWISTAQFNLSLKSLQNKAYQPVAGHFFALYGGMRYLAAPGDHCNHIASELSIIHHFFFPFF